ncbi:hypothetical protein B0H66DRAFT_478220 [Apodospora peruviana]|uniref:C2H2-type domain-containing protein n=1 Tax=Apodospora peruviana TaxID=516989 RepID=A0AAE0I1F1_9PEZI|nr:hypothetical protein B0H66DRAFT_478220 [Apodospora peruviana]
MASLKFIMDVDNEDGDSRPHTNKKDRDAGQPANAGQLHEASANTQPHQRHVSSSAVAVQEDINPVAPAAQSKRRGPSTRGFKSATTVSSSSLSTSTTRPPARRRSTASNDSMDPTSGGYGSGASSSSMGGRIHPSNSPMRPMPTNPPPSNIPMRLTPITGRVSRAKKGVPVHVCDICKPAKTFTRAEHLRRHQLSHQTPGYPCKYPGCDRAFHRPDLLTRHEQRHEQEGDSASSKGGSVKGPSQHPPIQQSPVGSAGPGPGPTSPTSTNDVPQTPNAPVNQSSYSTMSSPAHGSNPPTPHSLYGMPPSGVSIINPAPPSSLGGSFQPIMQPYRTSRTSPRSIYADTNPLPSLLIPEPPGLLHHNNDVSPWASSASDSTSYTPASDIPGQHHRFYMPNNHRSPTSDWPRLLSPYPNTASRDLNSPGGGGIDGMQAPPPPLYYQTQSHYASAPQGHSFRTMLDVAMTGFGPTDSVNQRSALTNSSDNTFRAPHQHNNSISSIRSPTPPPNTSSHASETLVTPSTLPSRLDTMGTLSRQKEMTLDTNQGLISAQVAMGGMGVLGGLGLGYGDGDGAGTSPGGDNGHPGSDILSALNLEMGGGCGMPGVAMAIPLARPVRQAIPSYIEVYWSRVHPQLPIVHRRSFETAPEDVLRCAMAAVATQYLNGREDRIRGNQLHEYAWQEAKRVPQWNLQIMQAILLCEHFARFRGRKAITRPSKLFESLYSRVSSAQFFATSSSSCPSDDSALWLVDTSAWSPSASSASSDCSSCASATPTTTTTMSSPFVMRGTGTFPSTPRSSFPSSYSPSAYSPFRNIPSASSSFGHNVSSSPYTSSLWARRSWSSLFAPSRHRSSPASSFPLQAQSQAPGHTYSQGFSNPQVLYSNPAMFDQAVLSADQHVSVDERWHDWLDAEQRRRLLTACFVIDGHAAIYQQQRRAHDCHMSGITPIPSIPLSGPSTTLFEASSANEWAAILNADPGSGIPTFVPPPEQITSEYLLRCTNFDRMAILGTEVLRLPRRQLRSAIAVSANNSPIAEIDSQTQHRPGGGSTSTGDNANGLAGLSASRATVYAARAIVGFFERGYSAGTGPGYNMAPAWSSDVADYWALYVCALICWAFGHRARSSSGATMGDPRQQRQRSTSGGSAGNSPASAGGAGISSSAAAAVADEEAMGWLRMVACGDMRLEDVVRVRGRREAGGVVGLVRRRLESDCVGGRSRLYVDAVGVLRKLEEGVNWKWF